MFFLYENGEGNILPGVNYRELSHTFNTRFEETLKVRANPNPTSDVCRFRKSKTTCSKRCVNQNSYCDIHFADERKQMIRSFFEEHRMYIPKNSTILPEIEIPESWRHFRDVVVRDSVSVLNTLSLIIQMDSPEMFNLSKVSEYLRENNDSIVEEKETGHSVTECDSESDSDTEGDSDHARTAFHNVLEFIVLFEMENGIHNASVKIWHNNYIHICGCKDIDSALRISSSVLRSLRSARLIHESAVVSKVNPVFANASFQFFPQTIVISSITKPIFLQRLRTYLENSGTTVICDNSEQYAQFCFSKSNEKTTIKVYPRGNVIITVNNFNGYLLQLALQTLQRTADDQNVYLREVSEVPIKISSNKGPFAFSPLSSNPNVVSSPSIVGQLNPKKRSFGQI
jgi:hypothetical protein